MELEIPAQSIPQRLLGNRHSFLVSKLLNLGASVFFAIREAISASRSALGIPGYYRLDCPATSERIRLSCRDDLVERSITPLKEGELCWGVPL
jgi:hypothetical protein